MMVGRPTRTTFTRRAVHSPPADMRLTRSLRIVLGVQIENTALAVLGFKHFASILQGLG